MANVPPRKPDGESNRSKYQVCAAMRAPTKGRIGSACALPAVETSAIDIDAIQTNVVLRMIFRSETRADAERDLVTAGANLSADVVRDPGGRPVVGVSDDEA